MEHWERNRTRGWSWQLAVRCLLVVLVWGGLVLASGAQATSPRAHAKPGKPKPTFYRAEIRASGSADYEEFDIHGVNIDTVHLAISFHGTQRTEVVTTANKGQFANGYGGGGEETGEIDSFHLTGSGYSASGQGLVDYDCREPTEMTQIKPVSAFVGFHVYDGRIEGGFGPSPPGQLYKVRVRTDGAVCKDGTVRYFKKTFLAGGDEIKFGVGTLEGDWSCDRVLHASPHAATATSCEGGDVRRATGLYGSSRLEYKTNLSVILTPCADPTKAC